MDTWGKQMDAGAKYPSALAFVVQLRRPVPGADREFHGRAEHVLSGGAAPFESLAELAAFMAALAGKEGRRPDAVEPSP